ncbi:MAG TPA: phenylalanine--tRNA ligase subunit beta, partial [Chitinophagaceae bacterium]|nr:phenylalanine--tRNA ligase subunit beta [Chitinophagaceae bacterium]
MKISYNWIKEYLPDDAMRPGMADSPKNIGSILTSVGLELESLHKYEEIANSLEGLIIGEVISIEKHPDADKLQVAFVNNGQGQTLQIVCGAPNIALSQKVVLAPVGATIHPLNADPFVIKKAKIRGVESMGMICAEDEIGIGESHAGIIILPEDVMPGTPISDYYKTYFDWILEIGLTPNRIDAMSHLGVAKDICAYISHQERIAVKVITPFKENFKTDNSKLSIKVEIENPEACRRYAGISISGITVASSPEWLQNKLKSIGVRPVNNVVDITNFSLHETGQPLHIFDADKIKGKRIIVKNLSANTSFITLDNKERKLCEEDLMICNGEQEPMCFGGVFGGIDSGVTNNTSNVFLESAWFSPSSIRKTSFRHNLRTEAAIRFEKGVDISNTVNVLKRAALLIKEIAGGQFSSDIVDVYPAPKEQTEIILKNHYLKRLSGKHYHLDNIKGILKSLNFSIVKEGIDDITVAVPFSNPDVTLPADLIEEIMRIDGLDNIEIPSVIKMTAAIETGVFETAMKDKIADWLTGNGFSEIFTNSITNSKYFKDDILASTIKIINSLSEDLNIMRPTMLPTGLESISYNLNRKNNDLFLFEFGNTYSTKGIAKYDEQENLALYFTGNRILSTWKEKEVKTDIYFVKGICNALLRFAGLKNFQFSPNNIEDLSESFIATYDEIFIAEGGNILPNQLNKFSIKQPVFYLRIIWHRLMDLAKNNNLSFSGIAKFPHVNRDLSVIIDKTVSYQLVEKSVISLHLSKLTGIKLFDVFESEKLGKGKKSFAIT